MWFFVSNIHIYISTPYTIEAAVFIDSYLYKYVVSYIFRLISLLI
jgi:hypothetical protein